MQFFLQGLTMGLAYVAPIGMQNLFVINAALTSSRRRALATAFIVLFFDVTLSLACFYGVGAIINSNEWLQAGILCVGSIIVMAIGVGLIRSRQTAAGQMDRLSLGKTISKACVVTWFNPQAILDGTMMLGAFRVTLSMSQATPFMTGVISASFVWFLGLTLFISQYSRHFSSTKALRFINIVCGAVIVFYGVKLFYNFLQLTGLL